MAYNGWSNYETWYTKLYLSEYVGDEGLFEEAREFLREADWDHFAAVSKMYNRLQELVDEIETEGDAPSGFVQSMYDAAKQRIDFAELATWYVEYCTDY